MTENQGATEKQGTFFVTHAGEHDAVLADVEDAQVHPLSSNPGVETGEVLATTFAVDPPLEATWSVVAVEDRWTVAIERLDGDPSSRARALVADADEGDLATGSRDDGGELHVLAVPDADAAATEVAADETTRWRAVGLGASRVEVRAGDGFVGVRYLP